MLSVDDVYMQVDNPHKVWREFQILRSMNMRDFKIAVSPATVARKVADTVGGYTRKVSIKLVDSNGLLLDQYTGTITLTASKSSVGGTATAPATVTMTNGVAEATVTLGGTWLAGDTNTLTVTAPTILGTVATVLNTSVETITA